VILLSKSFLKNSYLTGIKKLVDYISILCNE